MKHTKAPWTIERTHNTFEIARVTPKPGFETTRNIRETVFLQTDAGCLIPNPANASLIAAAPEMLEALEALSEALIESHDGQINDDNPHFKISMQAWLVIRKARGDK